MAVQTKKLLVVGDWVVDDYWVTGTHRTDTANRVGRAQLRALHSADSSVRAIVGAGRIASILHLARSKDSKRLYSILGLGMWHKKDTALLRALVASDRPEVGTPHQLYRTVSGRVLQPGIDLVNVADLLPTKHLGVNEYGTTRVIRVYRRTGNTFESLGRVDWELPPEGWRRSSEEAWVNSASSPDFEERASKAFDSQDSGDEVEAVVIKDLCKGVVSSQLVRWLASRYQNVPWFISTKAWMPKWLTELQRIDVRLFLLPQTSATLSGTLAWFTREKSRPLPTKEAMEAVNQVKSALGEAASRTHVVALPHAYTVLAMGVDGQMAYQPDAEPIPFRQECAMASVFFSSMIAQLLDGPETSLDGLIGNSLTFVETFAASEWEWRQQPEMAARDHTWPALVLDDVDAFQSFPVAKIKSLDWKKSQENWEQALSGIGTISPDDTGSDSLRIELSRAMTQIEGYVCCMPSKRVHLDRLCEEIRSFMEASPRSRHNVSGMLIAKPGSGKTSLVRGLAETYKMGYLDFNITQMTSVEDIIACFDAIMTTQAQNRLRCMLVFFDEINAQIQNQHVYEAFLAPLEEGVYLRDGKKYIIQPCVWLFASTTAPSDVSAGGGSNKASDFESRLTMDPIDLGSVTGPERVYCGVSMLRKAFPDIHYVSETILNLFSAMEDVSFREMRQVVARFQNVQYGRVSWRNVAKKDQEALKGLVEQPLSGIRWVRVE